MFSFICARLAPVTVSSARTYEAKANTVKQSIIISRLALHTLIGFEILKKQYVALHHIYNTAHLHTPQGADDVIALLVGGCAHCAGRG